MAKNLLENELLWEKKQEKKKLYKNWKLYAIALGIILIGASTGLGIYYGVYGNPHSEVTKIDLNTLNTSAITGTENMKQEDALNTFLENNNNITDLKDNIEAETFIAPTYISEGKLVINAKENTKYSGTITITINTIEQTKLEELNLDINIAVDLNATQDDVFEAFLDKNKNILGDNLTRAQVELSNFESPAITANGKLIITVKEEINIKYTGSIGIKIKYILDETNFVDVIRYLSDNNLLNFEVPTGTKLTNLIYIVTNMLQNTMNEYHEYANNIKAFDLYAYSWEGGPAQDDLDTKGYVWNISTFHVYVAIIYKDLSQKKIDISNLNLTFTTV